MGERREPDPFVEELLPGGTVLWVPPDGLPDGAERAEWSVGPRQPRVVFCGEQAGEAAAKSLHGKGGAAIGERRRAGALAPSPSSEALVRCANASSFHELRPCPSSLMAHTPAAYGRALKAFVDL